MTIERHLVLAISPVVILALVLTCNWISAIGDVVRLWRLRAEQKERWRRMFAKGLTSKRLHEFVKEDEHR